MKIRSQADVLPLLVFNAYDVNNGVLRRHFTADLELLRPKFF